MALTPFFKLPFVVKAEAYIRNGVVSITAATDSLTRNEHAGRTVVANKADGFTYTLPASSGSGDIYRVVVGTALTSNTGVVKVANATDVFVGGVTINDIGDTTAATADFHPTASTSDTLTLTASIGAGKAGDWVEFEDIATGKWAVRGALAGETDPANPFSATVS